MFVSLIQPCSRCLRSPSSSLCEEKGCVHTTPPNPLFLPARPRLFAVLRSFLTPFPFLEADRASSAVSKADTSHHVLTLPLRPHGTSVTTWEMMLSTPKHCLRSRLASSPKRSLSASSSVRNVGSDAVSPASQRPVMNRYSRTVTQPKTQGASQVRPHMSRVFSIVFLSREGIWVGHEANFFFPTSPPFTIM